MEEPACSKDIIEPSVIKSHLKSTLRGSDRVPHQPDRYCCFYVQDGDPIDLNKNDEDLINCVDALQRSNSKTWLRAMRSEMESMEINNVWTLVDLPERIKPIRLVAYFDYEI